MVIEMNKRNNDVELEKEISEIRVRYSTILGFISQLYRLVISVGFTLFVTRKLTVSQYGMFTTMMAVCLILSFPYGLTNLWIIRYYARKKNELVSAAITIAIIYAPIGGILALSTIFIFANLPDYEPILSIISSMIVVAYFLISVFRSIIASSKPYIEAKVTVFRETFRLVLAYIFVVILLLKTVGALAAVLVSFILSCVVYAYYMKKHRLYFPKPSINIDTIKKVLSNSYISFMNMLSNMIMTFERPVVTLLSGSTIIAAYLGVSYIPRSIILQSSGSMIQGLNARLLRSPSKKDIEDVLRIISIINIGMLLSLITFSPYILSLFRSDYINAELLFILYAIEAIVIAYSNTFRTISTALERSDLFYFGLKLRTTPLFKTYLAYLARAIISIVGGTALAVYLIYTGTLDPVVIALPYPTLWVITSIPYMIYTYIEAKKKIKFIIPYREILASMFSAIIATIITKHLLQEKIVETTSFWKTIYFLTPYVSIWLLIYLLILLALSKWTRRFIIVGFKYIFAKKYEGVL